MQHVKLNSAFPPVIKPLLAAFFALFLLHPVPCAAAASALGQLGADSAVAGFSSLLPPPADAAVIRGADGFAVYFVSVGQGDSIYLELPGGQNALIDGGPSGSASGPLAKFLGAKGVTHIDHVVLTHPHSDHYNGLDYVFSNISVGTFYDTRMDNTGATADEAIRAKAAAHNIPAVYPAEGDTLPWGGATVKVLHSCDKPVQGSGQDINDCSIVLRASYQNMSFMLTGDAGTATEAVMVAHFGAALKSDVLKVGHHGSRYSTSDAFLRAVAPSTAFIEVGKNNYGHPTKTTLDRLVAFGAKIFRTDIDGTVEYPSFSCPVLAMAR